MDFVNLNNYKKEFLNYMVKNEISNFNYIHDIKFNKKSISIKIKDLNPFEHSFYNDKIMLNRILKHLSNFIKENNINYSYDMDFLEYKFNKFYYKII